MYHLISSIVAWVPGLRWLGIFQGSGKIIGLLLLVAAAALFIYQKGRSDVHSAYKAEKAEAIEKDAKENQKIVEETFKDLGRLNQEIAEVDKKKDKEIAKIEALAPHKCLDVKLSDLGM